MLAKKIMKKWQRRLITYIALSFALFMLVYAKVAAEYVKKALVLCVKSVIPSIFPLLVISDVISKSYLTHDIGSIFSKPVKFIFGTREIASCPIILGVLCGFPVGAISLCEMHKRKLISSKEVSLLLTFINNPSMPFIIGAVGISMYGSAKIGALIYVCVLLAAITTGIICRHFCKGYCTSDGKDAGAGVGAMVGAGASVGAGAGTRASTGTGERAGASESIIKIIPSSVSACATSMLSICGCIVFFYAFSGTVLSLHISSGLSHELKALITGIFEISSGAMAASLVKDKVKSLCICAFICAFSGFSVHMQVMSVFGRANISFLPFVIAKFFQGLLASAYIYIYLRFISDGRILSCISNATTLNSEIFLNILIFLLFIFSLSLSLKGCRK